MRSLRCGALETRTPGRRGVGTWAGPAGSNAPRDMAAEAISGVVWWGRAVFLFLLVIWTWSFAGVPMACTICPSQISLP
jgi:hypothetical protein